MAADFVGDGQNGIDCNGHGTHVAGILGGSTYGVAKSVTLRAVRVIGCGNGGSASVVIAGVDRVTGNHTKPAVANMSLGFPVNTTLDTAVRESIRAGVTYVVAAGNSNQDAINVSPARVAEVLAVGATGNDASGANPVSDQRWLFSNWGSVVDLFAPGVSVTSAWWTSDTATNTISGTSMAAPHVAGVAALFLETNPTASPTTVTAAIINSSTPNKVTNAGIGSPNRLLYSLLTGAGPTYYEIVAKHTGKCLDVAGGSTAADAMLTQWTCVGISNQHFRIVSVGGGFNKIVARHSGKVLDVQWGSLDNGAPVWQMDENGTPAQQWQLVSVGGGYNKILARHSGKALDVAGGFTTNGTQVHQWDYVGIANQQWQLRPVQ